MADSLKRKTLANLGWTAGARGITLVLQLAANVVMAQQLSEVDFGIVGFAQIFVNLLTMMSDFGISSAAVQKAQLSKNSLYTAWTLRLILGVLGIGIAIAIAPYCAAALGQPEVSRVLIYLSLGFMINAFAFIPSVKVLRALDYKKYSIAQLIHAVVNAALIIVLALKGFAYWAIVIASLASTFASVVALNLLCRHSVGLKLEGGSVRHYQKFGGSLLVSWLLTFALLSIDNLFIGTIAGAATLGYYALAFTWGSKLAETMGSAINSVLFPTFSSIQDDQERLKRGFLRGIELTAFLAVGGYMVIFLVSEQFLFTVLGDGTDKWLPAVLCLKILCCYGIIRCFVEPTGGIITAMGAPQDLVRANAVALVCKLLLIYPAFQYYGIEGVAALAVVSYATQLLVFLPTLKAKLDIRGSELCRVLVAALASAIVAIILVPLIMQGTGQSAGLMSLVIACVIAGVLYLLAYGLFTGGRTYRELYTTVFSAARA